MPETSQESQFLQRVFEVVGPLRRAFTQLLAESEPAERNRRGGLAVRKLPPAQRSRLLRALATEDDLSTLYHLPGMDGLRRILSAARKNPHDPELLRQCETCVAQYEHFLQAEDVGRNQLHAVLGGFLPEARDAVIRTNSQTAFNAMANLIGHYAEVQVLCMILFPGPVPRRCNLSMVRGFTGWRRLRNDSGCLFHGYGGGPQSVAAELRVTDLDGNALEDAVGPALIESFCSQPLPRLVLHSKYDLGSQYHLVGNEVGAESVCTFYVGEVLWNAEHRFSEAEQTFCLESAIISTPCKYLLFDVLIHETIWPGTEAIAECYRVVPHGPVTERNRNWRQFDRIDLGVKLRAHAPGLPAIESIQTQRYGKLVEHALARLTLSRTEMRGFRCEMAYPVYGTQVSLRFDLT